MKPDLDSSLVGRVQLQDPAAIHVSAEQVSSGRQNGRGFAWIKNTH